MPLTPLQARFVAEYAKDQNGTQAAIRAGANPNSAHVTASRWLKDAKVADALAEAHGTASQIVAAKLDEAVGSASWIIEQAAATHREARAAEQFGPAVSALALMSKPLKEFSEKHILSGDPDNPVTIERRTRSTQ